jgi:hypothetical protein
VKRGSRGRRERRVGGGEQEEEGKERRVGGGEEEEGKESRRR